MANNISGVIKTTSGNQASITPDIYPQLADPRLRQPSIISSIAMAQAVPTKNSKFQHDRLLTNDRYTLTTTNYTAVATAIVVSDASIFVANHIVTVGSSMENMRVTNVDYSTNTLTVVRGTGTIAAAVIASGDQISISGYAHPEYGQMPDPTIPDSEEWYNYTQTFYSIYALSGREARHSGNLDYRQIQERKVFAMNQMSFNIEEMTLFGQRYHNSTSGVYASAGLYSIIETNELDVSGSSPAGELTSTDFIQFCMDNVFRSGSSVKYLYGGSMFAQAFSKWAKLLTPYQQTVSIRDNNGSIILDLTCYTILIPGGGELRFVKHHSFDKPRYNGIAIIVDHQELVMRYSDGGDLGWNGMPLEFAFQKPETILLPEQRDGVLGGYFSEVGLQVMNEDNCAKIVGVTSIGS